MPGKNLTLTSLLYGLAGSFPSIAGILIIPLIEGSEKLSAEDFSQIAIAEALAVFTYLISNYSSGSVISRFYWDFHEKPDKLKSLISTVISLIWIRGLALAIIIFFLSDLKLNFFSQPELQDFSTYSIPALIIGLSRSIVNSYGTLLRNQKKALSYVWLNIVLTIVRASFQVAGVYLLSFSFSGYVYGSFTGSLLILLFISILLWKKYGISLNKDVTKQTRRFAGSLLIYELVNWLFGYTDRFFLENNPVEMGVYDVAMRFALGIRLVIQGFQGASQPEIFSFMKKPAGYKYVNTIANIQIILSLIIIMALILPVVTYLTFFCDSNISKASNYIPLIFAFLIVKSQVLIFVLPVLYFKKTGFILMTNFFALIINLVINYIFIPSYGILAAIAAQFVGDLFFMIIMYFKSSRMVAIKWDLLKTVVIPLVVALFAGISTLIFQNSPLMNGTYLTFIIAALLLTIYYPDIIEYIRSSKKSESFFDLGAANETGNEE